MATLREKRQAVLDRLNHFKQPQHCDFGLAGECKRCGKKISELPVGVPLTNFDLTCRVITRDEVMLFRRSDEN